MARDEIRSYQGEFILFHLEEATSGLNEDGIADLVFGVKKGRFSKWMNGKTGINTANLVTAARFIHKHCNLDVSIPEFQRDFIKSFKYLKKKNDSKLKPGESIPNLARLYLRSIGELEETELSLDLDIPKRSSQIYHYTNNAVPVLGRKAEEAALERFRDAGPGFRWWQIAGVAGQGKSRLALDLVIKTCRDLPDWHCGFLDHKELSRFQGHWATWVPDRPVLMVLDYILGETDMLRHLVQNLSERSRQFAHPLCLLILERQAWNDPGSDGSMVPIASWYSRINSNIITEDQQIKEARFKDREGERNSDLVVLENVSSESLTDIVKKVATFVNGDEVKLPSDSDIHTMLRQIDSEGRPLYAYFLGLAIRENKLDVTTDASSLLDWVLVRERYTRWISEFRNVQDIPDIGDFAPKLPNCAEQNPAMHIAILATIRGDFDCNDDFFDEPRWAKGSDSVRRQVRVILDNGLSESNAPIVQGLQPDLLGEWFVLRSIERQSSFLTLVDFMWRRAPIEMSLFLIRVTSDFPKHPGTSMILDCVPDADNKTAMICYGSICYQLVHNLGRERVRLPEGLIDILDFANYGEYGSLHLTLGQDLYLGRGTEQDTAAAAVYFEASAMSGNVTAQLSLAHICCLSQGPERNVEKGLGWCHFATVRGLSSEAPSILAELAFFSGKEARDLLLSDAVWCGLIDLAVKDRFDPSEFDQPTVPAEWENLSCAGCYLDRLRASWLWEDAHDVLASKEIVAIRRAKPSFYPGLSILDLEMKGIESRVNGTVSVLCHEFGCLLLDGNSLRIAKVNSRFLDLTDEVHVLDYLKFWIGTTTVFHDQPILVEALEDIPFTNDAAKLEFLWKCINIEPPIIQKHPTSTGWSAEVTVFFLGKLLRTRYEVGELGEVNVLHGQTIDDGLKAKRNIFSGFFRTQV